MSTLAISQGTVGTFSGSDTPAFARLYADQTFTESGGARVVVGALDSEDFYKEITATLVGENITLAATTIYTTTDSNTPSK